MTLNRRYQKEEPLLMAIGEVITFPLTVILAPFSAVLGYMEAAKRQAAAQAYRHPALAPVRIESADFYANLYAKRSRHNRPYLGK